MGKRDRPDLLDEHQEWIDHMYNPGYWVNRVNYQNKAIWRWIRKHSKISGAYLMITSSPGIAIVLISIIKEIIIQDAVLMNESIDLSDPGTVVMFGSLLILLFIFIVGCVLFFQRLQPDPELEAALPNREVKKKKLPRRRKDYK